MRGKNDSAEMFKNLARYISRNNVKNFVELSEICLFCSVCN